MSFLNTEEHYQLFEAWYSREVSRIFNYIAYRVGNRQTAQDLTAAACEQALRHLDKYDPSRSSVNTWMFVIARDVLRKHYRREAREPSPIPLENLPPVVNREDLPETQAEHADQFRQVIAHMGQLTEDEQTAVALRFGAELTYKEIAGVMDCDANRVGVLLHRGLKKLQQALSEEKKDG